MSLRASVLFCFAAIGLFAQQPTPPAAKKPPKLVVAIIIDQFKYDYLNVFQKEYTGAFARFFRSA